MSAPARRRDGRRRGDKAHAEAGVREENVRPERYSRAEGGPIGMESDAPGFDRDIRPLFRPDDVRAMSFAFDLSAYEEVRTNAEDIYSRLADGSMPCDRSWPPKQVQLFRAWIDAGSQR
jgi:hypothetical protein